MTIPAEAVEAAAKMIVRTVDSRSWDSLLPSSHEWYRDKARTILEAAAPHMMAKPVKPKHHCEPWQIQVNSSGTFRYCAACGEPQP